MPLSEISCRRSAMGVVVSKSPSLLQSAVILGIKLVENSLQQGRAMCSTPVKQH